MKYVIAYDIADDAKRARVSALLAAHGMRIQRSVFECLLDRDLCAELLDSCRSYLDLRHDVLHCFPVCEQCDAGRVAFGQDRAELRSRYWVVI